MAETRLENITENIFRTRVIFWRLHARPTYDPRDYARTDARGVALLSVTATISCHRRRGLADGEQRVALWTKAGSTEYCVPCTLQRAGTVQTRYRVTGSWG